MRSSGSLKQADSSRFVDSLRIQSVVVSALVIREIHTRYGRENFGFVWLIIEPLLLCLGVIAIWTLWRGDSQHGLPVLAFVMTGYIPLTLWRHIVTRCVKCIRSNAGLLYHKQVRILDLLTARILLEFCGATAAFVAIAFVFWASNMYEWPQDLGLFYLGWFYMLAFSAGFGLIMAGLTEIVDWTDKLVQPMMYLFLPLSGVFFMLDWLPQYVREGLLWMPSVNAFEMIRGGQFGPSVQVYYDIPRASIECAAMLFIGLILCRSAHRHLVLG